MGEWLKGGIDWLFEPTRYFLGSAAALILVLRFRRFFSRPIKIIGFFVLGTIFLVWAFDDPDFH
jgi:hypothetical protein